MEPNRDDNPKSRRANLTDRALKGLKPAPAGMRYEVLDAVQPGLSVRVTSRGAVTFTLRARFPGNPHFTRKALGSHPTLKLAEAREKARAWLRLISEGKDPAADAAAQAERGRQEERKRQKDTFGHVAERYIEEITPLQRQGRRVARDIRNTLIPRWGKKPITDIDREDVVALLTEKRQHRATARNLFITARCLFAWAIETQGFGLRNAPTDHIKPGKLIGDRQPRDHTLTDTELAAFWRATEHLGYPEGQAYRLLALSGLRLNEAVRALWPEIDLDKRTWVIPSSRMKGKPGKAREHLVPLTDDMLAILEELPRFEHGDYLFTTTSGKKPIILGNKAKQKLDEAMLGALRETAKQSGENPAKVKLRPWTNHDLRRSCRSVLSAFGVPSVVGEAVLAHAQPGVAGTYDRYGYRTEKLAALQKWGDYLRGLVEPDSTPSNIVQLPRAAP